MKEDITTDPAFSWVSVTIMDLHPDGTIVQRDGGSAAGPADVSLGAESGSDVVTGQWRTENGVVHLRASALDRWIPVRYYVEDGRLLLTYRDDGRREIWNSR